MIPSYDQGEPRVFKMMADPIIAELWHIIERTKEIMKPTSPSQLPENQYLMVRDYDTARLHMGGSYFASETIWPDITENTYCQLIRLLKEKTKSGHVEAAEFAKVKAVLDPAPYYIRQNIGEESDMAKNYDEGCIKLDLLVIAHAMFLSDFCTEEQALFCSSLRNPYALGWLPCGWVDGKFPNGRLVVFRNGP